MDGIVLCQQVPPHPPHPPLSLLLLFLLLLLLIMILLPFTSALSSDKASKLPMYGSRFFAIKVSQNEQTHSRAVNNYLLAWESLP